MHVSEEDPMFDFASIEADFDGEKFPIKEIKYDSDLDGATLVYGNDVRPIGRTLGRIKPSCTFVMYKKVAMRFLAKLGSGFKRKVFPIVVKHAIEGEDIITDTVQRVRITKLEGGGSAGGDALETAFTTMPMGILWNGLDELGEANAAE